MKSPEQIAARYLAGIVKEWRRANRHPVLCSQIEVLLAERDELIGEANRLEWLVHDLRTGVPSGHEQGVPDVH